MPSSASKPLYTSPQVDVDFPEGPALSARPATASSATPSPCRRTPRATGRVPKGPTENWNLAKRSALLGAAPLWVITPSPPPPHSPSPQELIQVSRFRKIKEEKKTPPSSLPPNQETTDIAKVNWNNEYCRYGFKHLTSDFIELTAQSEISYSSQESTSCSRT